MLLATVSKIALFEYWKQKKIDFTTPQPVWNGMITFALAVQSMESRILFTRPALITLEACGLTIASDIIVVQPVLTPVKRWGYTRRMKMDDIIEGSKAQVDWYGFFDADGDLVFWDDQRGLGTWNVSGVQVNFHLYLH